MSEETLAADPDGTIEEKPAPKKDDASDKEICDTARARFTLAEAAMSDSREDELDDLRFQAGSPDNNWQWPQDVINQRTSSDGTTINARPCLTINKLPQHVRQVTNEQRQNRQAGKVIPVDDRADPDVAEVLNGVVRHIEYMSDADIVYDTSTENQVTFGEGYFRVLTDYCDPLSMDQDIKLGRIRNSFSVYMDPTIQDPCGADAKWCLITTDMLREDFEAEYPDVGALTGAFAGGTGDAGISAWISEKTVRVADYYYCEYEEKTLVLLRVPGINGERTALKDSDEYKMAMQMGAVSLRERPTQIKKVKYCKTNGAQVWDKEDWPGSWIPVVRVVGNEWEVDGQIVISGLVRNAKDAQRMYNYWTSQEAEMLALAPKAPFIGYSGQFEGYENNWKTANTQSWPYLEVNSEATDHEGRPLPLPQRAQPPMAQNGLLQAKMGAADDIKGTTGQYDASLGNQSQETSGRAILAREKQGDTGTYHYIDNAAKAVRFGTRQIIELIPKIYSGKRIARIIGIDGEIEHVEVDPKQQAPKVEIKDQQTGAVVKRIYNFNIGKYDVMATSGPSYMTKRQETAQAMVDMSQGASDPTLALVMKYFAIKNMDFPESQEFAAVLKKLAPPGLLDDNDETPEVVMLKKQVEELGGKLQQATQVMQEMTKSVEVSKIENEEFKADILAYKAETERFGQMAAAMTPPQVAALVKKTIAEMMAAESLEQEEPAGLESMEQQPMQPPMQPAQPGAMQ